MELRSHYANRTLNVSCTKDYTLIWGEDLCTVEGVLKAPGSLLATDRSKAVISV